MARTRLIRPAFFSDELMAELSIPTRLVYIGLWTLTDDAGYLDASVREIGAELFRFDPPRRREARVEKAIEELAGLVDRYGKPEPRIILLECGDHLLIPTIPDHRTQGGEKVFTIRKRHESRCLARLRRATSGATSDSVSDSLSDSDSHSSSDSVSLDARGAKKRPDESFADWARRVAVPS